MEADMRHVGGQLGFAVLAPLLFVALPAAQETAADFQGPAAEEFLRKARITSIQGINQGEGLGEGRDHRES